MNFDRGTKHFLGYSTWVRNILEIGIWGYETFPTFHNKKGTKRFHKKKCETFFMILLSKKHFSPPLPNFFDSQTIRIKSLANKKWGKSKSSCGIYTNKVEFGLCFAYLFQTKDPALPYSLYGLFRTMSLLAFSFHSMIFDLHC